MAAEVPECVEGLERVEGLLRGVKELERVEGRRCLELELECVERLQGCVCVEELERLDGRSYEGPE